MHANVQTRFNPATGEKALYYRLKESYRDVAGHVHSLILLNIGFEPSLTALQVRRIAFALTAYWVVNTIRCQLKREGESCYWTEIVRRMSTQKLVTTEGRNPLGDIIQMRQCSNPSKQATAIYDKLKLKYAPFRKIKICRTQSP